MQYSKLHINVFLLTLLYCSSHVLCTMNSPNLERNAEVTLTKDHKNSTIPQINSTSQGEKHPVKVSNATTSVKQMAHLSNIENVTKAVNTQSVTNKSVHSNETRPQINTPKIPQPPAVPEKNVPPSTDVVLTEGGDNIKVSDDHSTQNSSATISTIKGNQTIVNQVTKAETPKLVTQTTPYSVTPKSHVEPVSKSTEKPKEKRIFGRPGVEFETEKPTKSSEIPTKSTAEMTKPTAVKKKKPLFTMITGDEATKDSESFIESPTTGRDYVLPIVLVILSIPITAYIIKLIYRRGTEFTERQQYHRMYLIDGMYNSR